jgi:hypothetical protein
MTLIANRSEEVVAESVVVIKKLLQAGANQVPLKSIEPVECRPNCVMPL